jgi:hypothetical protein
MAMSHCFFYINPFIICNFHNRKILYFKALSCMLYPQNFEHSWSFKTYIIYLKFLDIIKIPKLPKVFKNHGKRLYSDYLGKNFGEILGILGNVHGKQFFNFPSCQKKLHNLENPLTWTIQHRVKLTHHTILSIYFVWTTHNLIYCLYFSHFNPMLREG